MGAPLLTDSCEGLSIKAKVTEAHVDNLSDSADLYDRTMTLPDKGQVHRYMHLCRS